MLTRPHLRDEGDDDDSNQHGRMSRLESRIAKVEAQVTKISQWIYFVMGGAAVAGYLLGEMGVVRKLFQ